MRLLKLMATLETVGDLLAIGLCLIIIGCSQDDVIPRRNATSQRLIVRCPRVVVGLLLEQGCVFIGYGGYLSLSASISSQFTHFPSSH